MAEIVMNNAADNIKRTKLLVLSAILFAVSLVLSIIEGAFPPIFAATPGVKLGLSNIVVMYSLFFLRKGQAFTIAILKAVFVYITRGAVAGLLSLSGGLMSLLIMVILISIFKEKISYLMVSIFGALFHNIGQLTVVSIIYTNLYMWAYLPVLLVSGVLAGTATSVLLRFIFPALKKLG
ncbi:MAG: Gx transporter family protein [Eubacteriales bacterium]|nr:Gx transporter family protein [Eubacteriales bacterium]